MGERTLLERRMQVRGFLAIERLHLPWMTQQLLRRDFRCTDSELSMMLTGKRTYRKSKDLLDGCEKVIQEYQSTFGKLAEKRDET